MRKLLIAAALLAAACTPSQAQQPHKFVTECRSTSFYGMVTTKCYEIDVTQRWLDYKAQEEAKHKLPSDQDSPEKFAAKKAAQAAAQANRPRDANGNYLCTKGLDC